jgi:N-methylhydantoinase A
MALKIGIDVGGTFTDFVVTRDDAEPAIFKTLSTPSDPSIAVVNGLTDIAASMNPPMTLEAFAPTIDTIVHGTTVTTNATLTGTGAKCGLLTTEGVRDALEMRRGIREEQYNNRYTNVKPLVPRYLRAGITGRLDRDGKETTPLDLAQIKQAIALFKQEGVQAVSICFMNSFANPAHEQAAAELVKKEMPGAYLSVSTDLLPSIRFYERVSTTALNSYVGPKLNHYLDQLVGRLKGIGFKNLLLIMQSNGGVITPQLAREKAALTLLSGPAGGPGAGLFYVRLHGQNKCITTDMGGTSFEASVAVDAPMIKNDGEIARHKIALPMLDIHTIGAGGGSIGWLDEGGMLRMGPQSAGADPGPACYSKGGRLPATTDANVVLGYLDPGFFAGGRMKLDAAAARAAIEEHIAEADGPVGRGSRRRHVPRRLQQHGPGRARSDHQARLRPARIPLHSGRRRRPDPLLPDLQRAGDPAADRAARVLGAVRLRHADERTQARLRAHLRRPPGSHRLGQTHAMIDEMSAEGTRQLVEERIAEERRRYDVKFDCRYIKQYHEVSFSVPRELIDARDTVAIARAFNAEHNRLYGYSLEAENTPIEIINVRRPGHRHHRQADLPPGSLGRRRRLQGPERQAQHVHPRDQELPRGAGLRRPQDALRQPRHRPGHDRAGDHGDLRQRRLRLRGRCAGLLRHLRKGREDLASGCLKQERR